jgi:glycosyltransferase involved in cell wall biosynthesis
MSKKKEPKILFVSHKANMSGAPMLLLDIVKEFKKRSVIPFQVLIMEDGELVNEFKLLGETFIWRKEGGMKAASFPPVLNKLFLRTRGIARAMEILFSLRGTSLIFFNTVSNGHILKKLLFLKSKHICYVHELEAAIHMTTSKESLEVVLKNTSLFIACSKAVKSNLVTRHAITENSVQVLPTPVERIYRNKKDHDAFIHTFMEHHKISTDAIVIGVVASNEWRKGFDLFLPLLSIYTSMFPASNVYFVWKGFRKDTLSAFFNLYDYEKFALNNCLLLPHGDDSIETMACFDIHLLISREDPYPLVVLEAASLGIPTVCFLNAGGSPEFIEEDAGISVPYGNLIMMADALHRLAEDSDLRHKMGDSAQKKIQERHAGKKAMPAFISAIEDMAIDKK